MCRRRDVGVMHTREAGYMLLPGCLARIMRSGMVHFPPALGSRVLAETASICQAVIGSPSLPALKLVVPLGGIVALVAAVVPVLAWVVIACGAIIPVMTGIRIAISLPLSVAAGIPFPGAVLPIAVAKAVLPIPIAKTVLSVPNIMPQVFAIAGKARSVFAEPALVAAQLVAIFPEIAIAKLAVASAEVTASGVATALLHTARAVSDFIITHALQPVDAVR